MAIQRGLRNNNPGNIVYNPINKWQYLIILKLKNDFVDLEHLNMIFMQ